MLAATQQEARDGVVTSGPAGSLGSSSHGGGLREQLGTLILCTTIEALDNETACYLGRKEFLSCSRLTLSEFLLFLELGLN